MQQHKDILRHTNKLFTKVSHIPVTSISIRKQHASVKYPGHQLKYQATTMGYLKKHIYTHYMCVKNHLI